ncbi:hypothetical protein Taro_008265, partial [Colocasia esculenta]|nr:hypothetical protein [Colocasia esculenta]
MQSCILGNLNSCLTMGRVEELLVAEELGNDHKKLIFFPVPLLRLAQNHLLGVELRVIGMGCVEELLVAEELWNDHKKLIFFPVRLLRPAQNHLLGVELRPTAQVLRREVVGPPSALPPVLDIQCVALPFVLPPSSIASDAARPLHSIEIHSTQNPFLPHPLMSHLRTPVLAKHADRPTIAATLPRCAAG